MEKKLKDEELKQVSGGTAADNGNGTTVKSCANCHQKVRISTVNPDYICPFCYMDVRFPQTAK